MKKIISLTIALIFIISNLQICNANDIYYDQYYDYDTSVEQPVFVPVPVPVQCFPNNDMPNIVINNHPHANASASATSTSRSNASSSSGESFIRKIIKFVIILSGLTYLGCKINSSISNFVSSVYQNVQQKFNGIFKSNNENTDNPLESNSSSIFSSFKNMSLNMFSSLSKILSKFWYVPLRSLLTENSNHPDIILLGNPSNLEHSDL